MLSNQLFEPTIHFTVFCNDKTPEISCTKTQIIYYSVKMGNIQGQQVQFTKAACLFYILT